MIRILCLLAVAAWSLALQPANAAQSIGLILPLDGRFAETAKLIRQGVETIIGSSADITVISNECDADQTSLDAEKLSEAVLVIGPLCFEAAEQLTRLLNPKDAADRIPVLAIGPRSPLLERARSRDGLPLFVLGKGSSAEPDAIMEKAIPAFDGKPFALIDDGAVHGRFLVDVIGLAGEARGIKPVTVATFRPLQSTQRALLQRLARSGVEALFIAGAPEDVVTIARDMAALGLSWDIAVADQAALLPYAEGLENLPDDLIVLRERPSPEAVGPSLTPPERDALAYGIVAGEIALQVLTGTKLEAGQSFQSTLGKITFPTEGRTDIRPYELKRWGAIKPAQRGEN